jgi:hypothetical protein
MKTQTELRNIKLEMLKKMFEWNMKYRYPYSSFDDIYDKKTLKREMKRPISLGYAKINRGGFNDDGE